MAFLRDSAVTAKTYKYSSNEESPVIARDDGDHGDHGRFFCCHL
jgi:hypothetical protein